MILWDLCMALHLKLFFFPLLGKSTPLHTFVLSKKVSFLIWSSQYSWPQSPSVCGCEAVNPLDVDINDTVKCFLPKGMIKKKVPKNILIILTYIQKFCVEFWQWKWSLLSLIIWKSQLSALVYPSSNLRTSFIILKR